MKHLNLSLFAPLLLAALAACSSGPSGGTPPGTDPPGTLFTESNAWTGEFPADAEQVTSADFQAQVASGELTLVSASSLAAQKAARQKQYAQDKATLTAVSDKSAYLTALLAEANSVPDAPGDQQASLPGGQTVLLDGLATRLRVAAEAEQQGSSPDNGTDDYARTYELTPPEVQARSPSPESLKGQSAEQVRSALNALDARLNTAADLDRLRAEPAGSAVKAQATLAPGNGSDNDAPCAAPKGLQSAFWFPLKSFLSPIKDQGRRGTCWAFAATAALDSREAVQNGVASNLSEQFLVNKVKEDWDSDDYVDGYTSEKALNTAADKGQAMPPEGGWTYNRSLKRPTDQSGSGAYANSCSDYSGTCSDTSHQSRRVCTTVVLFKFCGYSSVKFSGPGVAAGHTIQAWKSGETFNLGRYRTLMAGGHALLASFTVYRGFMDDAAGNGGYVTNFSQTKFVKNADGTTSEVKDSYGGHAVLIVGYVDNVSIGANPLLASIPQAPGGDGYFIVKNSWGCNTADAGYWYVPVAYVKQNFNRLSYLDFDARRSDAWKNAQATPGGAANITVVTNPARADLRVQTDVAQWFRVSQSAGAATTLTVTSDKGENLYSGPWTVASGTFGQSLNYTFATAGTRTLTLVARTGAAETRASLVVNVVNTAPTLNLSGSGAAYQGVAYPVTAVVGDLNESDAVKLCASTTWSADAPDTLASGSGCLQTVTFGATGPRQVRVVTHDSDGASTAQTLNVTVQPPPVNPYPKISAAGVYARDFHNSGVLKGCSDTAVGVGASIVLSEKGCTPLVVGAPPPAPQRYSGGVTVDNPSGEALTYDWTLYVTNTQTGAERVLESAVAQAAPGFQLYSPYNAGTTTTPCRLTVRVNAPEASRSKAQTVWSGNCTYETFKLN